MDITVRFILHGPWLKDDIVPPNPVITVSRTNVANRIALVIDVRVGLSNRKGHAKTPFGSEEALGVSHAMHCSIVGTCLSTIELRKIIARVKGHDLKGSLGPDIHEEAVLVAGHQDVAARLLQKALDRRYEATIKRFSRAKDVDEVRGFGTNARQWRYSGRLLGAPDAPATTQEMKSRPSATSTCSPTWLEPPIVPTSGVSPR